MSVRLRRTAVALAAGAALAAVPLAASTATAAPLAPLQGTSSPTAIPNHYIVVLKHGQTVAAAKSVAAAVHASTSATYGAVFAGFAAELNSSALAAVRANPAVDFVSVDEMLTLNDTQSPVTWGLDRIDQRDTPLSNSYTYTTSGQGVRMYMIDTGIRSTHVDFSGRIAGGANFVGSEPQGNYQDCNGHGTHTTGTSSGTTYGVAKGVTITSVRVIGCGGSGPTSDIVEGMDYVAANAVLPAVASMSIGGPTNSALDAAANGVIDAGVPFAISAGNDYGDACNKSPARVPRAITVAASSSSDAKAGFSNSGTCIDIFGPGVGITSDWISSDTSTRVLDGTSMATPHVAGVLARYLANRPTATVTQLTNFLISQSTKNTLTGVPGGTPNRLLYANPIY